MLLLLNKLYFLNHPLSTDDMIQTEGGSDITIVIIFDFFCSHGKGFEEFMCFGEGIFSDCVDRERVVQENGKIIWPAGDEPEEDEVEEV